MKKNIVIGLLIVLALVCYMKKDFLIEKGSDLIFGTHQFREDILTIVLNEPATEISPYSLNLNNMIRTANIFQGLVAFDRNLKITPALAVSWGNIDPMTWEFKLRRDVKFHDQSLFSAKSVIDSFNSAKKEKNSLVLTYINTIKEIKVIDDYHIQIITKTQDPLLLSKLTKFYINRPGNIGTGSYKIREWTMGDSLDITAFTNYWGAKPVYRNVEYIVTTNKTQRKNDYENGYTHILVAVPQEQALELPAEQIKTNYSLEVNFLMFKLDDELIGKKEIRAAIKSAFDPEQIELIGNSFVRQASQFIAPGVFGYNSNIPPFKYDDKNKAKNIFEDHLERIKFDYLNSYKTLSEYLVKQLRGVGFSVNDNPISPNELLDKIKNNASQLFLIGWQAEDGDAGGFLDAFIHSEGEFNNGRYKNEEIDKLIEESRQEMNPQKRLSLLQGIMLKIQDDLIGIPLFESSRLYAVQPGVDWEPRLDGLVLAGEVK